MTLKWEKDEEAPIFLDEAHIRGKCATKDILRIRYIKTYATQPTKSIELFLREFKEMINEMESDRIILNIIDEDHPIMIQCGNQTYLQASYGNTPEKLPNNLDKWIAINPELKHAWDQFQTAFFKIKQLLGDK